MLRRAQLENRCTMRYIHVFKSGKALDNYVILFIYTALKQFDCEKSLGFRLIPLLRQIFQIQEPKNVQVSSTFETIFKSATTGILQNNYLHIVEPGIMIKNTIILQFGRKYFYYCNFW